MTPSFGPPQTSDARQTSPLQRQVGLWGATMMGLGSIVGTGVFVSIGIAAGIAGPSVILATATAAVVATLNGLSSAQLAANHPVSGGTYEYGYRWLHPQLGFTAGGMFLCAKSASAATAALGFAGYASNLWGGSDASLVPIAVGICVLMTGLVVSGIRRSNAANLVIVAVTLISLLLFIVAGFPSAVENGAGNLSPFWVADSDHGGGLAFLEAAALMFVAYTGYGRIATLGEEAQTPRRTIPRAIILTLAISSALYVIVAAIGVCGVGSQTFAESTTDGGAPLTAVADQFGSPMVSKLIAIGAITAMLGVLLNLILGLSRVVLAMARRSDLPSFLTNVNQNTGSPVSAVLVVGLLIAGLTLIGDIQQTWSFSAFTVLIYYALTNLAATRLSEEERLFPAPLPWLGLLSCLSLAFWVEPRVWLIGLALIAVGLATRGLKVWFLGT